MTQLLDAVERQLGTSWHDVVTYLRDQNELDVVAERVHRGDMEGAIQGVEDAAAKFAIDTHAAYVVAGQTSAKWLDGTLADSVVRFDVQNIRAVAWANRNKLELVREISQEQRDVMRRVISDGVRAGENPIEVARDLRASIGLTDYQARIVANYRRSLESGDLAGALTRELSSGHSDRTIAAAMNRGSALTPAQIDTAVDRYRANWVTFRSETIARTEGLRVAHQGSREAFQQAVDAGDLDVEQLEREWHHASHGKDARPEHEAMDGQKRKLDEAFESGSGAQLMYPGDPSADASEILNCRCVVSTRLVA